MSRAHRHLYDPPPGTMRAVLFRDRPQLPRPGRGPLAGTRLLILLAPMGSGGADVRALAHKLGRLGAVVGLASECQGEARDDRMRPLYPHRLLVEIDATAWDAVVVAGGPGAARLAQDPLALALVQAFAAAGRGVLALGEGASVLAAARTPGIVAPRASDLLARLRSAPVPSRLAPTAS